MKYFEFTFRTQPCTETVNDVVAAILGEVGFESFVECEDGLTAYIQQTLCDENAIKIAINEFPLPDTDITIHTPKRKTRTGTRNGKRISSSPLSLATAVSSTAHSIATSLKLNTI